MIWIISFAFIFLSLTSLVMMRNHFEFKAFKDIDEEPSSETVFVSVCIPARNEERSIRQCVESVLQQTYAKFEVLVLDDQSTDLTGRILRELSDADSRLSVLQGKEKPSDWLGKPWACHQLSLAAKGDRLVFLDADVWMNEHALTKAVSELQHFEAITVWPEQKLGSFWEQMVVPMVYHALFSLLPAVYVERPPRWLPSFLRKSLGVKFVAACGQFIAFRKSAYADIGGHISVKDHVVEDVQLGKRLKEHGFKLRMLHGQHSVFCRMYHGHSEVWNGFKKNFRAGFNSSFEFLFMWGIHISVYLAPLLVFLYSLMNSDYALMSVSLIVIVIPILQRLYLARTFSWSLIPAVLHFASVLWFQILAVVSVVNKALGRSASWKGRPV